VRLFLILTENEVLPEIIREIYIKYSIIGEKSKIISQNYDEKMLFFTKI